MVDFGNIDKLDEISEIMPQVLYLTNYVGASDVDQLKKLKIKFIVNLTSIQKPYEEDGITYRCINDITDSVEDADKMAGYIDQLVNEIDQYIKKGNPVLVHCAAGISRSSTIVIAYIMLKQKKTLKEAFELVLEKRPGIWPNKGFFGVLIKTELNKLKKNSINLEEYMKYLI